MRSDAPKHRAAMRAGLEADAPADVVERARMLRDGSLNMGAMELAETCRSLEELARRCDLDGARPFLDRANLAFNRVRYALAGERLLEAQGA